jgi:hypothetical protein
MHPPPLSGEYRLSLHDFESVAPLIATSIHRSLIGSHRTMHTEKDFLYGERIDVGVHAMKCIEVRYTIEGVQRSQEFETIEEAESFVNSLLISYGDEYIQGLVVEQLE